MDLFWPRRLGSMQGLQPAWPSMRRYRVVGTPLNDVSGAPYKKSGVVGGPGALGTRLRATQPEIQSRFAAEVCRF